MSGLAIVTEDFDAGSFLIHAPNLNSVNHLTGYVDSVARGLGKIG
jgi:hypothetical protein